MQRRDIGALRQTEYQVVGSTGPTVSLDELLVKQDVSIKMLVAPPLSLPRLQALQHDLILPNEFDVHWTSVLLTV